MKHGQEETHYNVGFKYDGLFDDDDDDDGWLCLKSCNHIKGDVISLFFNLRVALFVYHDNFLLLLSLQLFWQTLPLLQMLLKMLKNEQKNSFASWARIHLNPMRDNMFLFIFFHLNLYF